MGGCWLLTFEISLWKKSASWIFSLSLTEEIVYGLRKSLCTDVDLKHELLSCRSNHALIDCKTPSFTTIAYLADGSKWAKMSETIDIAADVAGDPNESDASPNSDATGDSQNFWEETEEPWPATFERSISLLSSPILSTPHADFFTRSPKPGGTPLAGRRAQVSPFLKNTLPLYPSLYPLTRNYATPIFTQRGYLTPEVASLIRPGHGADSTTFEKGINKVHSLDFKSKYASMEAPAIKPLLDTRKEQSQKAMEAKAYRQKLLKETQDEEKGRLMSPGFSKEKKLRKKKQLAQPLEGKATFAQCVFNMANILMVCW